VLVETDDWLVGPGVGGGRAGKDWFVKGVGAGEGVESTMDWLAGDDAEGTLVGVAEGAETLPDNDPLEGGGCMMVMMMHHKKERAMTMSDALMFKLF